MSPALLGRPGVGQRIHRLGATIALSAVVLAGCATSDSASDGPRVATDGATTEPGATVEPNISTPTQRYRYPDPPGAPDGAAENIAAADLIDRIGEGVVAGALNGDLVDELATAGDARHAWYVADLLRFFSGADGDRLVAAFERLTATSIAGDPDLQVSPWKSVTNHLIAWDTPDYDGYQADKGAIFTRLESGWAPFFDDADSDIDWRFVSWGGVFIDDRELDDRGSCPGGCIPALDDPATTDAAGGAWYPDDRIVFGIVVGDEALAVPLNIAEIHEMFNLSLGGRRLAIPYCTLCGSAQAYFTDQPDGSPTAGAEEIPVVRTSGLLSRSNKVMYDLRTSSVFDTFTGAAVSGSLQDAGVTLEETTVVRSTWAAWKSEHPNSQIVAEDGGIGRSYELDPLNGRDDNGPIFPIGDFDGRLGVQEFVVGVLLDDGTAIAFPSATAEEALNSGEPVELGSVELRLAGDGLVAVDAESGDAIAAHEAFWFAWSQFHPDTSLWERSA